MTYVPEVENVETFQFEQLKTCDLNAQILKEQQIHKNKDADKKSPKEDNVCQEQKVLWEKLRMLARNLHTNNISDKRSSCFWCTCDFDNPSIHIPKYELNGSYHCYGCFCSPECAVGHLFKEDIDAATRFERYHMLNHIYCKIYDHEKNIKPAPNPHYTLDKFYGNLTIQEYRQALKNERLLLIVDKPLTRILPELHEDNDEYIFNSKTIPSSKKYTLKKRNVLTKSDILVEKFNFKT